MTDLRKAAEQALEVLEQLHGGCTDSDDGTVEAITVWCPEVIEDLRAAIAAEQAPDAAALEAEKAEVYRLQCSHSALYAEVEALRRDAERWADVHGFEGQYQVSTLGRMRSLPRVDSDGNKRAGMFLNPTAIRKGYLKVTMWQEGGSVERYVHRLVASAFVPNPDGKPQVNHIDGDPGNNAASNLEWATNSENQMHARRVLAKGVRAVYGVSTKDGSRIEFGSLAEASEAGFVRANIQKCISGSRKHHKGYAWFDAAIDAAMASAQMGE